MSDRWNYLKSRVVGTILCANNQNTEQMETLLRKLTEFMLENRIDKIDVGWACPLAKESSEAEP